MALFDTKYPNNTRVVSGTPQLYNDDVVLLCDTSTGPVTINLLEIPANTWSTQWKLYIIDNSNNASVNNITIVAGGSQLINTQPNLVLNTNGSGALIQIVSNTNFIGNLTYIATGGGAGYDLIKDEGVALTQRSTIDFVGEFVSASDNGAETEVNINPIIKEITNANLVTAINNSTLIKGLEYKVTDAPYVQSVTVMAIADNRVESTGKALKFVADYQKVGDYSGVVGFNANLGRWTGALTPIAGDICIWNNFHYLNTTGVNTATTPNLDSVNWSLLIESETTGYILEPMSCVYEALSNTVRQLSDLRLNIVDYAAPKGIVSFLNFPFGDNGVSDNKLYGDNLGIESDFNNVDMTFKYNNVNDGTLKVRIDVTTGFNANVIINNNNVYSSGQLELTNSVLNSGCTIQVQSNEVMGNLSIENVQNTFTNSLVAENNAIQRGCILILGQLATIVGGSGVICSDNILNEDSKLYFQTIDCSSQQIRIRYNEISVRGGSLIASLTNNDFQNNKLLSEMSYNFGSINNLVIGENMYLDDTESNLKKVMDLSDPLIYDLATTTLNLDLAGAQDYFGEFLIIGTGETINKITNSPSTRSFTLTASSGSGILTFRTGYVGIGVAVADEIIVNTSITSKTSFTSYSSRSERLTLKRGATIPNFNFVQTIENWN